MATALAFQKNSLYNKKRYARFGPGGTAFAARIVKGLNFLANQKKMVNDITSMDVDFSKWYTDIVKKAELMDYSSVKGCMIIEPYGYAIWENIQHELDDRFKATGHQNVYMPLFIPESLLQKEKDHVKGFAPEVAWVTEGGNEKLSERLCVRPTSEILFCEHYQKIINSYRDLPKLYNQWCSVVRWEKTTRPFLRSSEFLWQEGHTAHATREEAEIEAKKMQEVYANFAENYMAMPVIKGVKSESERFAGALDTYTIEAMMQDGKALQAGTSHFLGQNFGKAFDVTFIDKNGKSDYAWATSWGVSTRLIGALIMSHSDDNGLVLPPHLAPIQVVIVPIYRSAEQLAQISEKVAGIVAKLKALGISVKYDDADNKKPGWKFAEYELKGVPVRLAMGGRDLENNTIEVMRRDTLEKETITCDGIEEYVKNLLEEIQANIFKKAYDHREANIINVDTYEEFKEKIEDGVFIMAHWDGTPETEELIKNETKATIRCIPLAGDKTPGKCMVTGKPSACRVLFARAY